MIGRLNHVAIAVPDLEQAARVYADTLGASVSEVMELPEHGVRTVFVELPNTKIELLQPLGESSPVGKFLERNRVNTLILLTSGFTVTMAHHALKKNQRPMLTAWLLATVALGFIFVYLQIEEYKEAYQHLGLTLGSGIYGSTFFMLTGFHGMHVTLGAIMLTVIAIRSMRGHFTPKNHFGFEAVAWYWHFVDVVWLGLFIFVYVY